MCARDNYKYCMSEKGKITIITNLLIFLFDSYVHGIAAAIGDNY